MDVKLVNPFIHSVSHVMKTIGFSEVKTGAMNAKGKEITCSGVVLVVGIVGDLQGNIVYVIDEENAKQIASKLMMGMPVEELDTMAASSLSELSNMLSAHAATGLTKIGYAIDISPPNLMIGSNMRIMMRSNKVLNIQFFVDAIPIELNIAIN